MRIIIKYKKLEEKEAKNLMKDIKQANRDFWGLKFKIEKSLDKGDR